MKKCIATFPFLLFAFQAMTQINTITTAVPFLMITPDARAGGMGETGVAAAPDVNSIHWNPAQLAFAENKFGVGFSYTPWMRSLVPDINLAYLSFYLKPDSISAIGGSVRFFSMGNIVLTNATGNVIAQYRPYEYAADICYSRKLSEYWSGAIAARFTYSDLDNGLVLGIHPGKSIAGDLGIYYHDRDRVRVMRRNCLLTAGLAITNMGSKISYSDSLQADFIPINLRIGQGFVVALDSKNQIGFQYELNKLLVPSPPQYELDAFGNPKVDPATGQFIILKGKNPDVSVPHGMLQSFYDAPGGWSEEMAEINLSAGIEYSFEKMFFLRSGFFYEAQSKGNRQFFTFGAGIKFNICTLDFAYLIPTNGQRSPLQNTFRFSLQFGIEKFNKKNQ